MQNTMHIKHAAVMTSHTVCPPCSRARSLGTNGPGRSQRASHDSTPKSFSFSFHIVILNPPLLSFLSHGQMPDLVTQLAGLHATLTARLSLREPRARSRTRQSVFYLPGVQSLVLALRSHPSTVKNRIQTSVDVAESGLLYITLFPLLTALGFTYRLRRSYLQGYLPSVAQIASFEGRLFSFAKQRARGRRVHIATFLAANE